MAGTLRKIFEAPIAAITGFFGGAEDGFRGQVDENERYSDGKSAQDPELKSRAGRFLSDYAGVRGGERVGTFVGKWGGAAGAGYMAGSFLLAFVAGAGMVGAFPIIASIALAGTAAVLGGVIGKTIGKHVGRVAGAITGAIGGALVGAYSAVFRRGYYKDPEVQAPEPAVDAPAVDAPSVDAPSVPERGASPELPVQEPSRPAYSPSSPPPTPGSDRGVQQSAAQGQDSFVGRLDQQRAGGRSAPAGRSA